MTSPTRGTTPPGAQRRVRLYVRPTTLGGRLYDWRYLILRRVSQLSVLLLFFGTAHWGWSTLGRPLLSGNLSAAKLVGSVPLADPFATLQLLLTLHSPTTEVLLGAAIILGFYTLVGGRVFCAWVCPVNMVTDLAGWLQARLGTGNVLHLSRKLRYSILVLALILSPIAGLAAFEWVSPIAMLHREIIFGVGMGLIAVAGIFLFDLLVLKHGWCGHLCPLGAFYALMGRAAQVRVALDRDTCTSCGECNRVCPEPQVLNLNEAAERGFVRSGECTNCARCIPICPEHSLAFTLRVRVKKTQTDPVH